MLCIIREGDGAAFRERGRGSQPSFYLYAAVNATPWQRMTIPKIWQERRVEIFVAEPKEEAPSVRLPSVTCCARLGIRLLVPYRDAPDKCSQNNTQQSQGGLLPKVRHH